MRHRPNQISTDIEVRQHPEGCAIREGMELMGMTVEGPLPQEHAGPLFKIVRQCETEGCEVVINLATIGSERKFFYIARGKAAVAGMCQAIPSTEPESVL